MEKTSDEIFGVLCFFILAFLILSIESCVDSGRTTIGVQTHE